jgi:hypothetical protein
MAAHDIVIARASGLAVDPDVARTRGVGIFALGLAG